MNRIRRRRILGPAGTLAGVCLTGVLVLTACGGSSGGSSGGGTSHSVTVATSTQYSLDEIGIPGAKALGTWSDKGLSVKVVQAEDLGRTMASGSADIGVGSPTRLIGPMLDGTFQGVMVGPDTDQLQLGWAVRKGLNVSDLSQLKGKTFGVSSFGALGDLAVHLLARQQGWSSSDFKEVSLGGPDGLAAGLERGSIDAFAWTPLLPASLQGAGKATVVPGTVAQSFTPVASSAIFATPQIVQEHPQTLKAFCDGFYEAQTKLKNDPNEVTNILVQQGKQKDSPDLRMAVKKNLNVISTSSDMSSAMLSNVLKAAQISSGGKMQSGTVQDLKKHYRSCSSL